MFLGQSEPTASVRRPAGAYLEEYVEPAQPKQFDPRWPSNRHKVPPWGSITEITGTTGARKA